MSKKNQVPSLRFKGFTDAWEQRKLGDMAERFEYGLNASAVCFDGENKYIRITDIDDLSRVFKQTDLTSPEIDFSAADNYLIQQGDILFARTGASVGKTYIYQENDGKVYFAGFLIRGRFKRKNISEFIFQNTLTYKYFNYIRLTSQRSGQPGVNAQEYMSYELMVPQTEEQEKIGVFLKHLDNLITLHQRKYDKLVNIKKALLEKMFPENGSDVPKIRFKGFTEAWEQRKLDDIASKIGDGLHGTPQYSEEGNVYFINGNNLSDGKIVITEDTKKVTDKEQSLDDIALDEDTILMSINGTIGNLALYNGEKLMLGKSAAYIKIEKSDKKFLFYTLQTKAVRDYFFNSLTGTTIKNLGLKTIRNTKIFSPNLHEQEKIGTIFSTLNNLITLHQRKLLFGNFS